MEYNASSEKKLLSELRDVARRYCALIDDAANGTDLGFLRRMNAILPELYWRAQALPDIDPWANTPEDEDEHSSGEDLEEPPIPVSSINSDPVRREQSYQEYKSAEQPIRTLLGKLNVYRNVFDPYEDQPALEKSLSDDLADIYHDLHELLRQDETSGEDETERMWDWRFGYSNHWGTFHLPSALNAIAWLVNQHWDEDDEVWTLPDDTS